MARLIFGQENAEWDKLLYECPIYHPPEISEKQILTGRWGAGKSAILFLRNKKLTQLLKTINEKESLRWYLNESSFDALELTKLREDTKNEEIFVRQLEQIWHSEIVRTTCILLNLLRPNYKNNQGKHWDFVSRIAKMRDIDIPLWSRIPEVLSAVFDKKELYKDAQKWTSSLQGIRNTKAYNSMQDCLHDIGDQEIKPIVAIEPLESPKSKLEKNGIAQPVITALLNVFIKSFASTPNQHLEIQFSIPWHRYINDNLDMPQKIPSLVGNVKWQKKKLRQLINLRIGWEFKQLDRSINLKGDLDFWDMLFENKVKNDYCRPAIYEESFSYIARHTHHRARDILRIARTAVEHQSSISNCTIDEVLKCKKVSKVSGNTLKEATRKNNFVTTKEIISESQRMYPKIFKLIDAIRGVAVPFSSDNLKGKLKDELGDEINSSEALKQLWQSGIIGTEIIPNSTNAFHFLMQTMEKEALQQYESLNKKLHRWYLFEYNSSAGITEILSKYKESSEITVHLILHPSTFENLSQHISQECPLGV